MRYKQVKLRLEALILKNQQMIWGYKSAIVRTKSNRKRASYTSLIVRLENSRERIKAALDYCMMFQKGDLNYERLCSQFGFKAYKQ